MEEPAGKKLIYNGSIVDYKEVGSSVFYSPDSVYEVIRVIDSVALFLENHLERFARSLSLSDKTPLLKSSEITHQIYSLIRICQIENGNIRISFNYSRSGNWSIIHTVDAQYPTDRMYINGVDTILYQGERQNPEAKVYNSSLRSLIQEKLLINQAFEALLVNGDGWITEGSKSNVFFIRNKSIITAPDRLVLSGITRRYVLELCKKYRIDIDFRCLSVDELTTIESVFISGTSPHILPVRKVDDNIFFVNDPVLQKLRSGYSDLVDEYVRHR